MARIPTEYDLGEAPLAATRSPAGVDRGEAIAFGAQAQAMQSFAGAMDRAGHAVLGAIQEAQNKDDDYEITKTLIGFQRDEQRRLDEAKHNMQPGGDGFAEGYRNQYTAAAKDIFAQAKAAGMRPESLKRLDQKMLDWQERFHTQAYHAELQERDRFHTEDVTRTLTEVQNVVQEHPERVGDQIAAAKMLISTSKLPLARKADMMRKVPALLEEVAARTEIERDPERAIMKLQQRPHSDRDQPRLEGSEHTIEFIKKAEGDKDNGWDVRQYSGPYGVKRGPNERLSLEEADRRLRTEVTSVQKDMDAAITTPMSQEQRTALTSLFYNIGTGKGRLQQVAQLINSGQADKVPDWIRQFTRDADGKYLPGLASRRSDEARMFAAGIGTAPVDKVERGDLPPPGEGDQAPRGQDAEPAERYDFRDDAPYRHLSFKQRSTLLNVARTSMRATTEQSLKDDVERIRRTGEGEIRGDGTTVWDIAGRIMTKNQMSKYDIARREAKMEHEATSPLASMNEDEAMAHLERFVPDEKVADGESYKSAARVYDKAEKTWKKITELRDKDPARSVAQSEEVKAAFETIKKARGSEAGIEVGPDGEMMPKMSSKPSIQPQQAQQLVIEARLRAQERLGIPEWKRQVIDKDEARKLMQGADPAAPDFDKQLRAAAGRATAIYGPQYGARAFQNAVGFLLHGASAREEAADAIKKAVRGQPVAPEQIKRIDQLRQIDMIGRTPEQLAPSLSPDRPAISPFAAQPAGKAAADAGKEASKRPSQRQLEWLRANPEERQSIFDQEFGRGAAATALSSKKR